MARIMFGEQMKTARMANEVRLTDLLRQANEEMRDFLRRVQEIANAPRDLDASHLKSLSARLAEISRAVSDVSPDAVTLVRADPLYSEYKALLDNVRGSLEPLRGQLLVRQAQLGLARFKIESARAWAAALERTR